jgi:hypothetical protein
MTQTEPVSAEQWWQFFGERIVESFPSGWIAPSRQAHLALQIAKTLMLEVPTGMLQHLGVWKKYKLKGRIGAKDHMGIIAFIENAGQSAFTKAYSEARAAMVRDLAPLLRQEAAGKTDPPVGPKTTTGGVQPTALPSNYIESLRGLELRSVEINDLKSLLGPMLASRVLNRPQLQFSSVWRARVGSWDRRFDSIHELWYPPPSRVVKLGRANNFGVSRFYCADHPGTAVFECKGPLDVPYILVACELRDPRSPLNVLPLGIGPPHPSQGGTSKQPCPPLLEALYPHDVEQAAAVDEFLREQFMLTASLGEEHRYKLTAALAELLLDTPCEDTSPTDGLVYAPVGAPFGSNLVLTDDAADRVLKPVGCWQVIMMRDPGDGCAKVFTIATAEEFGPDGQIFWIDADAPKPFFG